MVGATYDWTNNISLYDDEVKDRCEKVFCTQRAQQALSEESKLPNSPPRNNLINHLLN